MDQRAAEEITLWRYEKPYDFYNWGEDDPGELLDGSYYAVYRREEADEENLWAFVCYGVNAQINPEIGRTAVYTANYTDIGLGMAPQYCGKGWGGSFLKAALSFGRGQGLGPFRLTVAKFNQRAAAAYQKAGFREEQTVLQKGTGRPFVVMTLNQQGE